MPSNSDQKNLKVPNGTKLFADGHPRLTYGGFVGSAKIDSRYALKVKNEDVYVDIRDFIPNVSTSRDRRKRHAHNMLTQIRRREFARAMAKQANLGTGETVLTTPNGAINAQVAEVKHHLIGTTDPTCSDVVPKILSGLTVQVVDADTTKNNTTYTTYEVDPLQCQLVGFNAKLEKNWIEQNNVHLVVPTEVALAALPPNRRAAYEAHRSQFPKGGLIAPISGKVADGMFDLWFERGFTLADLPVANDLSDLIKIIPTTACVVSMTPRVSGTSQIPKFFVVDDLSDLMQAMQSTRGTVPNGWWDTLKKCINPITDTVVKVVDAFMDTDRVTRNGYSLRDMENVVWCKNFSDVCRNLGYSSIPEMFTAMASGKKGSENFWDLLIGAIPTVVDWVVDLFDDAAAKSGEKKVLDDGEIDYSQGGYPFAPGEVSVVSRSTSGIGASGTFGEVSIFPPNHAGGSDPREEETAPLESVGTYSVGNSIPRSISWALDPEFEQTGGTMDNVGVFLQYSSFDFSRIAVSLTDSLGFVSPCNTDIVSVHGFDSSKIGFGVAVLEIIAQGSTALTASFPYQIVSNPILTCLAAMSTQTILVGSEIDPRWITTAVSDSLIDGSPEYKNVCALTPAGYEIDPVDTSTPGWKNVTIRTKTEPSIEAVMRVNVVKPDLGAYADYRGTYDIQAYLSPDRAPNPGLVVLPKDIRLSILYRPQNATIFYGTAQDLMAHGFVTSITLNGGNELKLVEGENTFVFLSQKDGVEFVGGRFTEKVVREVSEVGLELLHTATRGARKDNNGWINLCHPLADILSGGDISTEHFQCSLLYADGGAKISPDDEFSLDIVYPPSSADESGIISAVKVRATDIVGYETQVFSGRSPSVVVYGSESSNFIGRTGVIASVEYKSNRLPWIGEIPNPEDFVVMAKWTGVDGGEIVHKLHTSAFSIAPHNSQSDQESEAYTMESDSVIVRWGDQSFVLPMTIARVGENPIVLGSITAVPRKGKSSFVSYGTPLTEDFFEVTGVSSDGTFQKELTDNIHIRNYFPMFSGLQDVSVQYGTMKSVSVPITVRDPEIVSVVVTPRTTIFDMGEKLAPSDIVVTATTSEGVTVEVPSSQVRLVEFDTGFIGDQTFMGTVECVGFEDSIETGGVHTSSFRFDVGLGGGDARYTTPALVCRFDKPYCFVGDRITSPSDLGFAGAFVVASDGERHVIEDTDNIHIGTVDTSKSGSVIIGVEYTPVQK